MSKLEQLINELCPDGVEYINLEEILDYEQPTKYIVKETNYNDGFKTPVLTAGQSFILGYTNEEFGIYEATKENPTIIFDDFTTSFHWVDFNFKIKSSAMKMLRINLEEIGNISFRYVYHCMKNIIYNPADHSRQWIGKYSKFQIPLPPLPVQEEIVRILDTFTELTAELTAELTMRKQQYEYYRDSLLTFGEEVEWKPLGEICELSVGGDVPKNNWNKEMTEYYRIPIYSNGIENDGLYGYTNFPRIEKSSVTIAGRGAGVGNAILRKNPYFPIIRLISATPKDKITADFLYYFIKTVAFKVTTSGIPQLTIPMIKNIQIPLPTLKEQQCIVDILDRFDTLVNDIKDGLPAEIEARKQQYEYYRDKLLTFKKLV